jgi:hypothetical protein
MVRDTIHGDGPWTGKEWTSYLYARDTSIEYKAYKACKSLYSSSLRWEKVDARITLLNASKHRLRPVYALAACAILFTAFTVARVNVWPEMYEYARQGDYRKVLALYANAPLPLTPYERYQAAYTEYYSGQAEEAELQVRQLLKEDEVRTQALFLLASIMRDTARYDESHHYLLLGFERARDNRQHQLSYFISCYLAHSYAVRGDFLSAEHIIQQAYLAYKKKPDKSYFGDYLDIQGRIHLLKGELGEAICFIKARLENERNLGTKKVHLAYAELALIYGILGDPIANYYHEEAAAGDMFESERQQIWRKIRQLAVAKANNLTNEPFFDEWNAQIQDYANHRDNLEIPLVLTHIMEHTNSRRIDYDCEPIVP